MVWSGMSKIILAASWVGRKLKPKRKKAQPEFTIPDQAKFEKTKISPQQKHENCQKNADSKVEEDGRESDERTNHVAKPSEEKATNTDRVRQADSQQISGEDFNINERKLHYCNKSECKESIRQCRLLAALKIPREVEKTTQSQGPKEHILKLRRKMSRGVKKAIELEELFTKAKRTKQNQGPEKEISEAQYEIVKGLKKAIQLAELYIEVATKLNHSLNRYQGTSTTARFQDYEQTKRDAIASKSASTAKVVGKEYNSLKDFERVGSHDNALHQNNSTSRIQSETYDYQEPGSEVADNCEAANLPDAPNMALADNPAHTCNIDTAQLRILTMYCLTFHITKWADTYSNDGEDAKTLFLSDVYWDYVPNTYEHAAPWESRQSTQLDAEDSLDLSLTYELSTELDSCDSSSFQGSEDTPTTTHKLNVVLDNATDDFEDVPHVELSEGCADGAKASSCDESLKLKEVLWKTSSTMVDISGDSRDEVRPSSLLDVLPPPEKYTDCEDFSVEPCYAIEEKREFCDKCVPDDVGRVPFPDVPTSLLKNGHNGEVSPDELFDTSMAKLHYRIGNAPENPETPTLLEKFPSLIVNSGVSGKASGMTIAEDDQVSSDKKNPTEKSYFAEEYDLQYLQNQLDMLMESICTFMRTGHHETERDKFLNSSINTLMSEGSCMQFLVHVSPKEEDEKEDGITEISGVSCKTAKVEKLMPNRTPKIGQQGNWAISHQRFSDFSTQLLPAASCDQLPQSTVLPLLEDVKHDNQDTVYPNHVNLVSMQPQTAVTCADEKGGSVGSGQCVSTEMNRKRHAIDQDRETISDEPVLMTTNADTELEDKTKAYGEEIINDDIDLETGKQSADKIVVTIPNCDKRKHRKQKKSNDTAFLSMIIWGLSEQEPVTITIWLHPTGHLDMLFCWDHARPGVDNDNVETKMPTTTIGEVSPDHAEINVPTSTIAGESTFSQRSASAPNVLGALKQLWEPTFGEAVAANGQRRSGSYREMVPNQMLFYGNQMEVCSMARNNEDEIKMAGSQHGEEINDDRQPFSPSNHKKLDTEVKIAECTDAIDVFSHQSNSAVTDCASGSGGGDENENWEKQPRVPADKLSVDTDANDDEDSVEGSIQSAEILPEIGKTTETMTLDEIKLELSRSQETSLIDEKTPISKCVGQKAGQDELIKQDRASCGDLESTSETSDRASLLPEKKECVKFPVQNSTTAVGVDEDINKKDVASPAARVDGDYKTCRQQKPDNVDDDVAKRKCSEVIESAGTTLQTTTFSCARNQLDKIPNSYTNTFISEETCAQYPLHVSPKEEHEKEDEITGVHGLSHRTAKVEELMPNHTPKIELQGDFATSHQRSSDISTQLLSAVSCNHVFHSTVLPLPKDVKYDNQDTVYPSHANFASTHPRVSVTCADENGGSDGSGQCVSTETLKPKRIVKFNRNTEAVESLQTQTSVDGNSWRVNFVVSQKLVRVLLPNVTSRLSKHAAKTVKSALIVSVKLLVGLREIGWRSSEQEPVTITIWLHTTGHLDMLFCWDHARPGVDNDNVETKMPATAIDEVSLDYTEKNVQILATAGERIFSQRSASAPNVLCAVKQLCELTFKETIAANSRRKKDNGREIAPSQMLSHGNQIEVCSVARDIEDRTETAGSQHAREINNGWPPFSPSDHEKPDTEVSVAESTDAVDGFRHQNNSAVTACASGSGGGDENENWRKQPRVPADKLSVETDASKDEDSVKGNTEDAEVLPKGLKISQTKTRDEIKLKVEKILVAKRVGQKAGQAELIKRDTIICRRRTHKEIHKSLLANGGWSAKKPPNLQTAGTECSLHARKKEKPKQLRSSTSVQPLDSNDELAANVLRPSPKLLVEWSSENFHNWFPLQIRLRLPGAVPQSQLKTVLLYSTSKWLSPSNRHTTQLASKHNLFQPVSDELPNSLGLDFDWNRYSNLSASRMWLNPHVPNSVLVPCLPVYCTILEPQWTGIACKHATLERLKANISHRNTGHEPRAVLVSESLKSPLSDAARFITETVKPVLHPELLELPVVARKVKNETEQTGHARTLDQRSRKAKGAPTHSSHTKVSHAYATVSESLPWYRPFSQSRKYSRFALSGLSTQLHSRASDCVLVTRNGNIGSCVFLDGSEIWRSGDEDGAIFWCQINCIKPLECKEFARPSQLQEIFDDDGEEGLNENENGGHYDPGGNGPDDNTNHANNNNNDNGDDDGGGDEDEDDEDDEDEDDGDEDDEDDDDNENNEDDDINPELPVQARDDGEEFQMLWEDDGNDEGDDINLYRSVQAMDDEEEPLMLWEEDENAEVHHPFDDD